MESDGTINILIVEDELDTAKMIRLLLEKKLPAHCEIAANCETLREKLPLPSTDLITLDYQLPDGDGLTLLSEINSTSNPPPVVMVTGHGDERTAIEAFRQGASGYVVKDSRLSVMLVQEIKSALLKRELRKAELELIENEKLMREIYDTAMGSVAVIGPDNIIEYANNRAAAMFGFDSPEELTGTSILDRYTDLDNRTEFLEKLRREGSVRGEKIYFKRKDGTVGFSVANATMYSDEDGNVLKSVVYATYEATQEEVDEARGLRDNKYRLMFDNMNSGVVVYDVVEDGNDFVVVDVNRVAAEYDWVDFKSSLGKSVRKEMPEVTESGILEVLKRVWLTGESEHFPATLFSGGGNGKWIQGYVYKLPTDELIAVLDDVTEKLDSERDLVKTREILDRIYNLAAEGIVVSDADNRVEYANKHALDLFGFSEGDEFAGELTENWYVDPEIRKRMLPVLQKKGFIEDADVELKRKNGGTFWARFNVSAEKDAEGNYVRGITFMTDITKQRESEEALRRSEAMLRSIYDSSLEGILVTDTKGDFIFANEKAAQLFGFNKAEDMAKVTGNDWYRYPDERDKLINKLLTEGTVSDYEIEYKRRGGDFFWGRVSGALQRDSEGNVTEIVGFMVDITKAKEAEAELKARDMNLREIYDRALEGISVVDSNGDYVFMNQRHAEIFGFESVEEMLGTNVADRYVNPEDREIVMSALLEKGSVENYEAELLRKDGTAFWAIMNYVIHRDDTGKFIKYSGFLIDINRRKKIEDERRRANEELEAYAHTVSHNLKGPLAAISLAADMLYQAAEDTKNNENVDLPKTIKKNAAIGQSLVENLLRLAEYGQKPIDVETIDIKEVVDEVLKVNAGKIKAKGFKVEVDDDMGRLRASRTQILMVFSSLIGNAIKHNDSENPEIRIASKSHGKDGVHKYLVWDNGSGIPEDQLDKIFIPFFKGRVTGETGLGLSIARKISNLYGGDVKAYNDNGVCFEATLKDWD